VINQMLYRPTVSTSMKFVSEHVTYFPYSHNTPKVAMYDNKTM